MQVAHLFFNVIIELLHWCRRTKTYGVTRNEKIIYLPACLLLVPTFGCGKNSHAKRQQNNSLPHYNSLKIYHNINENGKIINCM